MRLRRVLAGVVVASAAAVSSPSADSGHARLAVQVTVPQRCVVTTGADATVSVRCTRGTRSVQAGVDGGSRSAVPLFLAPEGRIASVTTRLQPAPSASQPPVLTLDF